MDGYIFGVINGLVRRWRWFDLVVIFFARYFEFLLHTFLLLLLLLKFQYFWPILLEAMASAVMARLVIAEFIYWLWQRPRPFVHNQVNTLLRKTRVPAFPSGHASFYFALSQVVYFYYPTLGLIFFGGSILIVIARVFAGVHWPSDIIAGLVIGLFSAQFIHRAIGYLVG